MFHGRHPSSSILLCYWLQPLRGAVRVIGRLEGITIGRFVVVWCVCVCRRGRPSHHHHHHTERLTRSRRGTLSCCSVDERTASRTRSLSSITRVPTALNTGSKVRQLRTGTLGSSWCWVGSEQEKISVYTEFRYLNETVNLADD